MVGGMLVTTSALSSPPSGVTATTFATGNLEHEINLNDDRIKLQTKGATGAIIRKLEFAPGGTSGWHHHQGFVLIIVQSGSVVVSDSNCGTITYGPGSSNGSVYVEGKTIHNVTSVGGAVLYLASIAPPPIVRLDDPVPSCQ